MYSHTNQILIRKYEVPYIVVQEADKMDKRE